MIVAPGPSAQTPLRRAGGADEIATGVMRTVCDSRRSRARVTITTRSGRWTRSQLARGEQPRQLGVDAGEVLLGVGGGVAGGAAKRRRGGEETLGVLGRGELVAVVGDDELEAELAGCGGGQRRAPPQLAHLTTEGREIGLRPLARARRRRCGRAAAARIRALLPLPTAPGAQLRDGVVVVVDEPQETGGEGLVFDIRAGSP